MPNWKLTPSLSMSYYAYVDSGYFILDKHYKIPLKYINNISVKCLSNHNHYIFYYILHCNNMAVF